MYGVGEICLLSDLKNPDIMKDKIACLRQIKDISNVWSFSLFSVLVNRNILMANKNKFIIWKSNDTAVHMNEGCQNTKNNDCIFSEVNKIGVMGSLHISCCLSSDIPHQQ